MQNFLSLRASIVRCLIAVTTVAFGAVPANAATYPTKPISFIVPYPVGGASDVIARLIAERLQASLKQPVVVENRAGANGMIAYSFVAKAPSDGYTILMANIGPSAINPSIYKKLPYNVQKDFAPISLVSWVPLMLVTNPTLDVSNVADLLLKVKASKDGLSYGVAGNGTAGHLAMELFKSSAGVDMKPILYKGDAPALADTIAGHINVMMPTVFAAAPHVASGRLKALAVTTPTRLPAWPNIPTVSESGILDFQAVSWGGVLAPARTPKTIVDKLNTEIVKILKQPEVKERFAMVGAEVMHSTPEEFEKFISAETQKWNKIAQAAKVSMD